MGNSSPRAAPPPPPPSVTLSTHFEEINAINNRHHQQMERIYEERSQQVEEMMKSHREEISQMNKSRDETVQNMMKDHLNQIDKIHQQSTLTQKLLQGQNQTLAATIKELVAQLKDKKQENKTLLDPELIEKNNRQAFLEFLRQLPQISVKHKIPKAHGVKYAAIMGQNSAGKSSIYNHFLGCNEQVGVDDTTQEVKKVKIDQERGIAYFDSPGLNQEVDVTNLKFVQLYYQIDIVFIVTAVTFKFSKKAIQIMNHINPAKFFLVRTQCDKYQTDQDLQKACDKDHKLLEEWGISREILLISNRKGEEYKDNARFKRILLGEE